MNTIDVINIRLNHGTTEKALWQDLYEYSGDNLIYHGMAPRGTSTAESKWIIERFSYSGTQVIAIQTAPANSVWNDRAGLTYA